MTTDHYTTIADETAQQAQKQAFDFDKFLAIEKASKDTIDFKKIYVDIAGGDVLAGLALSEIIFWYLPDDKHGKPNKLRVKHDGYQWIACRRHEWWDRTRMSPRQSDRVLGILERQGLIKSHVYKFNGEPTKHVRLLVDKFLERFNYFLSNPLSNPYSPDYQPFLPNGKNELTYSQYPITENTYIEESDHCRKVSDETFAADSTEEKKLTAQEIKNLNLRYQPNVSETPTPDPVDSNQILSLCREEIKKYILPLVNICTNAELDSLITAVTEFSFRSSEPDIVRRYHRKIVPIVGEILREYSTENKGRFEDVSSIADYLSYIDEDWDETTGLPHRPQKPHGEYDYQGTTIHVGVVDYIIEQRRNDRKRAKEQAKQNKAEYA